MNEETELHGKTRRFRLGPLLAAVLAFPFAFAEGCEDHHGGDGGDIKGSVDGKKMSFEFIAHWHSPYKHVFYDGTKR